MKKTEGVPDITVETVVKRANMYLAHLGVTAQDVSRYLSGRTPYTGVPRSSRQHVLARYLNAAMPGFTWHVGADRASWVSSHEGVRHGVLTLPHYLEEFTRQFDQGAYPELVDEDAR